MNKVPELKGAALLSSYGTYVFVHTDDRMVEQMKQNDPKNYWVKDGYRFVSEAHVEFHVPDKFDENLERIKGHEETLRAADAEHEVKRNAILERISNLKALPHYEPEGDDDAPF